MTCCRSLCFTANLAYYVSRVVQVRWPDKRSFSVTTSHNSYPLFLNYPLRNWRRRCAVGRTGVRGSRSCLHNRCRGDIDDVIAPNKHLYNPPTPFRPQRTLNQSSQKCLPNQITSHPSCTSLSNTAGYPKETKRAPRVSGTAAIWPITLLVVPKRRRRRGVVV